MIGTKQAAEMLGISPRRVRALITAGRLPSMVVAGTHLLRVEDLRLVEARKTGRPKKKIKNNFRWACIRSE